MHGRDIDPETNGWVSADRLAVWVGLAIGLVFLTFLWATR
jgi:hypothetical protein